MGSLWRRLAQDDAGFVVSSELVLVSTIAVLGMIVGLTSVRDQVVQELGDVSAAFSDMNQSYYLAPIIGHHSSTGGAAFLDTRDDCDSSGDPLFIEPACIQIDDYPYARPYAYWRTGVDI
jgi:hypothetical protein